MSGKVTPKKGAAVQEKQRTKRVRVYPLLLWTTPHHPTVSQHMPERAPLEPNPELRELRRTIWWVAAILGALLLALNIMIGIFVFGSASMAKTTTEMLELSRSMNESTTTSMTRLSELLSGVNAQMVETIVTNAVRVSSDVATLTGPLASTMNTTHVASALGNVLNSIDTASVALVTRRMGEVAQVVAPAAIRLILEDASQTMKQVRALADRIAERHNIQLLF